MSTEQMLAEQQMHVPVLSSKQPCALGGHRPRRLGTEAWGPRVLRVLQPACSPAHTRLPTPAYSNGGQIQNQIPYGKFQIFDNNYCILEPTSPISQIQSQSLTTHLTSFLHQIWNQISNSNTHVHHFYFILTKIPINDILISQALNFCPQCHVHREPFKSIKVQITLSFPIANNSDSTVILDRLLRCARTWRFYVKSCNSSNRIAIIQIESNLKSAFQKSNYEIFKWNRWHVKIAP